MIAERGVKGKGICLLLVLAVCLALPATNSRAAEVSATFRGDVVKLLKVTGAQSLGLQMGQAVSNQLIDAMSRQNPNIPPKAVAAIKEEVNRLYVENMPALMTQLVQVYEKHFTQQEVEGLIAFYETPLGKKAVREMPKIMNESFRLGQEWGRSLVPELRARLNARLKKEGFGREMSQGGAAH